MSTKPRACWCADPDRTLDEMYQCPAGDAGEDCLAHDYLAVDGPFGYGLGGRLPIPDLTDLRNAVEAKDAQSTRPSVRGGARLHPSDEDGYRKEQGT